MSILYWDLENGVDAPAGGTTPADPLLTWAQIKTELGGVPGPGDEIRIMSPQIQGDNSNGGGNAVYTQGSAVIQVPNDLTNPTLYDEDMAIIGPDGRLYRVYDQDIVASGEITIYGLYQGATVSEDVTDTGAGVVRRLQVVQTSGRDIGTDPINGSDGSPVTITGGWYNNGGSPAQETVNGRIVPTLIDAADVDDSFWIPSDESSYVTFRNIGYFPDGGLTAEGALVHLRTNEDVVPTSNIILHNCHAKDTKALIFAHATDQFSLTECSRQGNPNGSSGSMIDVYPEESYTTNPQWICGLTITNCRAQNGYLVALGDSSQSSYFEDIVISDVYCSSNGVIGGGNFGFGYIKTSGVARGLAIDGVTMVCPTDATFGIYGPDIQVTSIFSPLADSALTENYIRDVDILGGNDNPLLGTMVVWIRESCERFRMDNIEIDTIEGATGAPLFISFDPDRGDPKPIPVVDVTLGQRVPGTPTNIMWDGVGDMMLIDCSITDPVIGTDVTILTLPPQFNFASLIKRDAPNRMRFLYTNPTSQLPENEKQIVSGFNGPTGEAQLVGYVEPDAGTKVSLVQSTRINQISADDDTPVVFLIPLPAGQRAITASVRKNGGGGGYAPYGSSNLPGIEVTYYTWDGGALTENVVSDYMSDVDDSWETVTAVVDPDHDQIVRVKFANRSKVPTSLCWIDNLLAA